MTTVRLADNKVHGWRARPDGLFEYKPTKDLYKLIPRDYRGCEACAAQDLDECIPDTLCECDDTILQRIDPLYSALIKAKEMDDEPD